MAKPMSSERPKSGSASEQWPWAVARRASEHWQRKAIRLVPNTSRRKLLPVNTDSTSETEILGHTVSVFHSNMSEPLAKQYQSKSSSNTVTDLQICNTCGA